MFELLEYEASILIDIHHDSSLLVVAEGLGIDAITYALIKLHCDPHNLLIVCNYRLHEAHTLSALLKKNDVVHVPTIITAEVSNKDREGLYKRGGVIFVSSRILVVDLLMDRMPASLVSGILLMRAHELQEACQDCFSIRLLRERNNQIVIKALTDNPTALSSGYNNAERIMTQLGIQKLVLWPRFNLEVISCLNSVQPTVEEVKVKLSSDMTNCQAYLLDLIKASLKELLNQNPTLNNDNLSLERAILPNFDHVLSLYIDPIWNQLNSMSRLLVNDLATLRRLLRILIEGDAVQFLQKIEDLRLIASSNINVFKMDNQFDSNVSLRNGCSSWLLMDQADGLLRSARSRVYSDYVKKKLNIELSPKLGALLDILKEIYEADKSNHNSVVLVLIGRENTARLVEYFLSHGFKSTQRFIVRGYQSNTTSKVTDLQHSNKLVKKSNPNLVECDDSSSSSSDEKNQFQNYPLLPIGCRKVTVTSSLLGSSKSKPLDLILRVAPTTSGDENSQFIDNGTAEYSEDDIHKNCYRLHYVLNYLKPTHIISYEPKIGWVREIEIYSARRYLQPSLNENASAQNDNGIQMQPVDLKVYFILYESSVEEQRYLTTLRREKESFESMIRLKSTIVVAKDLVNPFMSDSDTQQRIIVDMREFRSELPALLNRRGFKIEPVTLTVADYILAPHLCVERKSISDLIGSLNSGRLYQQCTIMSRHYPNPILLIEFSMPTKCCSGSHRVENIGFSLYSGKHVVNSSSEFSSRHLLSRLTLLTIHFPNLRIFWSMNPYCTAELFAEVKLGRTEPSVDKLPQEGEHLDDHNVEAVDMLLKMPGISWKNYRRVVNNVNSLNELADLSLDSLTTILDSSECATKLYNFIHKKFVCSDVAQSESNLGENSNSNLKRKKPRFNLVTRVKTRRGRSNMKPS